MVADMPPLVKVSDTDKHEGGVQTLIDEEVHPATDVTDLVRPARGLDSSGTRLVLFIFKPRSLKDFGRPRRGWAATQILASSSIRSVSLGWPERRSSAEAPASSIAAIP